MGEKKSIKKLVDFETKRSIHINMTRVSHSSFKKVLIDYSLSMQEVLEHFAYLVGHGDNSATQVVLSAFNNKSNKEVQKLNEKETENMYDAISTQDPFG